MLAAHQTASPPPPQPCTPQVCNSNNNLYGHGIGGVILGTPSALFKQVRLDRDSQLTPRLLFLSFPNVQGGEWGAVTGPVTFNFSISGLKNTNILRIEASDNSSSSDFEIVDLHVDLLVPPRGQRALG